MNKRGDLFVRFAELGIATATVDHAPMHTVAESRHLRGVIPGVHTKNLFLIDKAGGLWLVTAEEATQVDLKALAKRLGVGRFSFGRAELMQEVLGITPGAVTPFAVLNDAAGRVRLVLDETLLAHETINAHPLDNSATTSIARDDLLAFLRACGHEPLILPLRPDV